MYEKFAKEGAFPDKIIYFCVEQTGIRTMLKIVDRVLKYMIPTATWSINDSDGIYLTFDDGPTPGVTEWILATLDKYDAKATFFVLGKNAELYPDLYQKIIAAGHKIGNHTYSHQKGWRMSLERYIEDIDCADDIVHSELFRPPYARVTPSQMRAVAKRFQIVMWSIVSHDYNRHFSPQRVSRIVLDNIKPGSIVVFHDSEKAFRNMSYALIQTLEYAKQKGWKSKIIEL